MLTFSLPTRIDTEARLQDDLYLAIHQAFTEGEGLYITDYVVDNIGARRFKANVELVGKVLERLPAVDGFSGIDHKESKRKTLGTIHQFNRCQVDFAYVEEQLSITDGDKATLIDSIRILKTDEDLVRAIEENNKLINYILKLVMNAIRYNCGIPYDYYNHHILKNSTIRLRAAFYDSHVENSSCGVHPDGNLLSVLITNARGFRYFDKYFNIHEPDADGIIVLPGTMLYRWSNGLYKPVFHYVKDMISESKTSMVYFYNLEINKKFKGLPFHESSDFYYNDIVKYKWDDIDRDGLFGCYFDRLIDKVDYT